MFELTLANIKNYLRVEDSFDDNEIEYLYLPAAKSEVKSAITFEEEFYTSSEDVQNLFNLAVLKDIAHHYENRSTTTQFERHELPHNTLTIIQFLRGEYAKWKSDVLNTGSESTTL